MLLSSLLTFFSLILGYTGATQDVETTPMLEMFDAMQQMMTGEPEFPREYYQEFRSCMNTFDPLLTTTQDHAWQGIMDYWLMDGVEGDRWGSTTLVYLDQNVTQQEFLNMTIYEPCDYTSNVAYAHPATEICKKIESGSPFNLPYDYVKRIGITFSSMVMGSSFMHMSHTDLGGQQDVDSIKVLSYLLHQGSISNLPASSIVRDFSETPRALTALELCDEFQSMYLSLPVENWHDHTNSFDIPDYYVSFAGIFSNVMTLAFPDEVVDQYAPLFMEAFGLKPEYQDFIMTKYIPEIRNLTADIDLGLVSEALFVEDGVTTVLKLVYAFLWQEEILTDNPIFLNSTVNEWGWEHLPVFNTLLNQHNTYEYFDLDFQNGTDIYPGDFWCNPDIPHAKWHLESAIGLLDLTYLVDRMYTILS